ncbi:hypothetical protein RRG08_050172 [Elysia crispata]|uniref:Uncharacterized protein n=1 Tax=Elysia crispata TaxID=231223 RepID=A0AAE0YEV2_9GAST|nr:hypothetical protein RRG08_050172 [Elysia crispata]
METNMNWRDVPTFAQGADRCEPTLASLWPPGQQKTPPETEGSRENTGEIARLPLVMIMLVEYTGTSFGIPVPTNGRGQDDQTLNCPLVLSTPVLDASYDVNRQGYLQYSLQTDKP